MSLFCIPLKVMTLNFVWLRTGALTVDASTFVCVYLNRFICCMFNSSPYNSSKHRVFVNIMRNKRHTCRAAFSNAPGDLPLNKSIFGRK